MQFHWIFRIKETWSLAHLLKISASESIFDDDINKLLFYVVFLVAEAATKHKNSGSFNVDFDGIFSSLDRGLEYQIFLNLIESIYALT